MWFAKSREDVLKELDVDERMGLTSEEAKARLARYGANQLKGKRKKNGFQLFIAQLHDMLIYVLLGAAVITLLIGEYVDSLIILAVVFLNALIGVIQEFKAEKAIEALQQMTTPRTLVKRDGHVQEISSEEIVPGDLVMIDAGRYIPADLRLLESANLQIDESALTGESVPTDKEVHPLQTDAKMAIGDQANMAFMSTLATYGRGEGVVVATAMDTEIGKIAKFLDQDIRELTPLQKKLGQLGKTLGYITIGICVLIFIIALIQQRDLFEMFLTAISLAVAAIPEGLPAIVAIVLALGVTRMSKINAIVKKLPAVETLGSVNIICSDKTGTLTQNKMTVVQHYISAKETAEEAPVELMKALVLCSDATYENDQATGDPTEVALVAFAEKHNLIKKRLDETYPRISEKPFDSDRKMMSTLNQIESGYRVHTKGAIDQILQISTSAVVDGKVTTLTEELKRQYATAADAMSNDALRVLAVAYKDCEHRVEPEEMEQGLTLLGFVGMIDPPRAEVKDSIREAKAAGITPIMITGDHKNTAFAIAKQLEIADSIEQSITGAEIDELSEEQFSQKINRYRVFARVSPEHKVKIVKAFKMQGNIVSMTGDGVNDAPSLKHADIGVAMGITGTDVSKGASDIILTDDRFTTIVHAIREGRNIYINIRKVVIFLLSCNLGEVVAVLASILFFWPVPLLPTQILWINLVTDTLPAISLGVDPEDKEVMKKKPRDPREGFFAHGAWLRAVLGGVLIGAVTLVAFYVGLAEHGYGFNSQHISDEAMTYARTMAFVVLAASQLFYSLSVRSATKSIFQVGLFSNKFLVGAILIGFMLQFLVIFTPFLASAFKVQNLTFTDWGWVIGLGLIPLLINEIIKVFVRTLQVKTNETRD